MCDVYSCACRYFAWVGAPIMGCSRSTPQGVPRRPAVAQLNMLVRFASTTWYWSGLLQSVLAWSRIGLLVFVVPFTDALAFSLPLLCATSFALLRTLQQLLGLSLDFAAIALSTEV